MGEAAQLLRRLQPGAPARCTGSSCATRSSPRAWTPGGWTPASRRSTCRRSARCRPARAWAARVLNAWPLMHTTGCLSGPAPREPEQARLYPHPLRLCRAAAQRGRDLVRRHHGDLGRLRPSNPRRPELLPVRHSLLDHRHRRFLRQLPRRLREPGIPRTVHALVPVGRVLPDLPRPRRRIRPKELWRFGPDTETNAGQVRQPALPPDALYLLAGLAGDSQQRDAHARPRHGLPRRQNCPRIVG